MLLVIIHSSKTIIFKLLGFFFMFYIKINSFVFSHTDGKLTKNNIRGHFLSVCLMADVII